jgi:ABC-type transporter Mla maintaining outer membrane lipid asymmetry permease subunit MlaE
MTSHTIHADNNAFVVLLLAIFCYVVIFSTKGIVGLAFFSLNFSPMSHQLFIEEFQLIVQIHCFTKLRKIMKTKKIFG